MTDGPGARDQATSAAAAVFDEHRPALLGAAYRVLGTMTDAEDAVQETWMRWAAADHGKVESPRAYLLTAVTRQALNIARTQERRREAYVGPWLPEPVTHAPDTAELAESVSIAMLVVLESLSPAERATFVLHEVFGMQLSEVAETLQKSPAAVRQLAHRAREHVQARRPRQPVDRATHREVTERFLAAASGGSIEELMGMLAPDVVLYSDGGGLRRAALRPILGAEKVLRFGLGVMQNPDTPVVLRIGELNGRAALIAVGAHGVDTVTTFLLDGGLITEVYVVRNPEKLRHVEIS
nr:RNA polymerase sigma factor SigJ [Salinibacterium sp.]